MAVEGYDAQIKALLSNKDSLTKKVGKDGRNQYQVQMNKLKKRMKADGVSFNKALQGVKKQEREGNFDRGAEGKAKNKLRKKMAEQPEKVLTKGRHKGSDAAKIVEKDMAKVRKHLGDEGPVDFAKHLAGETDAERKARKNKMTKAKIAKSR
jgi:hypothetical protein